MTIDIQLRDVIQDDIPVFFEYEQDPVANQRAGFPARERAAFFAHWQKIMGDATVITKAIVFGSDVAGSIVGWEQSGEREVGYWIGRPYWGKGIATQALLLFLEHATMRPLYAYVVRHNRASVRVLEKCGFQLAGETADDLILKLDASIQTRDHKETL